MTIDRKARIRAYKETPRPMGVYRVRNVSSGRSLIGSSTDVGSMLNRHQAQLRLGVHSNRTLQRDWEELGAESFEFEVLDTLPPADEPAHNPEEDLRVLEDMWRQKLLPGEATY